MHDVRHKNIKQCAFFKIKITNLKGFCVVYYSSINAINVSVISSKYNVNMVVPKTWTELYCDIIILIIV